MTSVLRTVRRLRLHSLAVIAAALASWYREWLNHLIDGANAAHERSA